MTRRIVLLLTVGTLMAVAVHLLAHDSYRVVGVIASHSPTQLVVKTRDGKAISMEMNKLTRVTRDKKKVDQSELKVGRTVVVDAYGDSEESLLAVDVAIVPAIPAGK
jgi:hypothetical protein